MNVEKAELLKARAHWGDLVHRRNPQMKPYIAQKSGKIHLFDEQKIIDCLSNLKSQITRMIEKENKTILFVATSQHLAEAVQQIAISCQAPYLVYHWPGGFLTNFSTIKETIKRLKSLLAFQNSERFTTLSKKEQIELEKKINRLKKTYQGVLDLPKDFLVEKSFPHLLLFIIGLRKEKTALREARKAGVPVMAICNTSSDPSWVDYLVLGNDWKASSVNYLVKAIAEIIRENRTESSSGVLENPSSQEETSATKLV